MSKYNKKHGMTYSREWYSWVSMKTRCSNIKANNYHNYGGRGISVCARWECSFENFYEDMGERPEGMSLDRIDNDKGYYMENCRWADRTHQSRNSRSCKLNTEAVKVIKFMMKYHGTQGRKLARLYGVTDAAISRIKKGLSWADVHV